MKSFRAGVNVPGVRMVDAAEGVLGIEWIEGTTVRRLLPGGAEEEEEPSSEENEDTLEEQDIDPLEEFRVSTGGTNILTQKFAEFNII